MKNKYTYALLIILIIASAVLRFYNLNWGGPFYFHPDERNIASAVSQLQFPLQMNPHFFAYGSLPIYTIFFNGIAINILIHQPVNQVSFEEAILISRFFSASFSLLLIPLIYFIGKKLKDQATGLVGAFLVTVGTGCIQYAHFGTFEMWLTMLSALLFLLVLELKRESGYRIVVLTALVFGAGLATKVSHLLLLPIPLLALVYTQFYKIKKEKFWRNLKIFIRKIILFFVFSFLVFLITNPFIFLDFNEFSGSMKYESSVALGTLPVFYTGEFKYAIPVVFQFFHSYPFLLNPLLTVLFVFAFIYILILSILKRQKKYLLLLLFFLALFVPQAFIYAKWTRYLVPTLPFIYLIIALAFSSIWKIGSKAGKFLFVILWIVSCIFGVSYFITAFVHQDTREAAAEWAKSNIRSDARIISEVYDMGIVPFNSGFPNISLFNFYDLDNNSPISSPEILSQQLHTSDYIILPSQRVLKIRLQNRKDFPNGNIFYTDLLSHMNGYSMIYETDCDLFCRIAYPGSPVFGSEETVNVFDRPTLMIFKKD